VNLKPLHYENFRNINVLLDILIMHRFTFMVLTVIGSWYRILIGGGYTSPEKVRV